MSVYYHEKPAQCVRAQRDKALFIWVVVGDSQGAVVVKDCNRIGEIDPMFL